MSTWPLLWVLGACRSEPPEAPAPADPLRENDGDTLVVGIPFDPDSANPLILPYALSHWIADLVEPGLVRRIPDAQHGLVFEPVLASSSAWSDDGRTLTFTLRDLAWEDGEPLTSADVAFTWSLVADPAVASNWHGDARHVLAVEAPDPRTAIWRFTDARSPVIQQIPTSRGIVPAHALKDVDRATLRGHESARHPLASGPWRIAGWAPDERVVLEPNPRAPADWRPHLDRIVLRVLPEYATRLIELEGGGVDLASVELVDAARLAADPRLRLIREPADSMQYVGFNLRDPRFADLAVREALSMAIDREALIRELYTVDGEVYATPCTSTVAPTLVDLQLADLRSPVDPEAARARLADRHLSFSLMIQADDPQSRKLATRLQAAWQQVGVSVTLEAIEPTRFSQRARNAEFEALLWSFGNNPAVDPSIAWRTDGQYNWFGYADPETDALIDRSLTSAGDERRAALHAIQRRVHDAYPAIFLVWTDALLAVDRRLHDVETDTFTSLRHAERWWVPAAEHRYR